MAKKFVGLTMEEDLIAKLKIVAENEQRSFSSLIRHLATKCIREHWMEDLDTSTYVSEYSNAEF